MIPAVLSFWLENLISGIFVAVLQFKLLLHLPEGSGVHRARRWGLGTSRKVSSSWCLSQSLAYVLYSPEVQEARTNHQKIFHLALFEKIPKLIIFYLLLHTEFTEHIETLFGLHIWIPDIISFQLSSGTTYFYEKIKFSLFQPFCNNNFEKWKFYFFTEIYSVT